MSDKYALRGVSSGKEDVHNAIKNIDKGLFPKAFCKVVPDYLENSPLTVKERISLFKAILVSLVVNKPRHFQKVEMTR